MALKHGNNGWIDRLKTLSLVAKLVSDVSKTYFYLQLSANDHFFPAKVKEIIDSLTSFFS
jgi:hypothetical protein